MQDVLLEIRVPINLLQFGLSRENIQNHVTEWLALSLFTEGRVSSGKAAKLLGMNRIEFLTLLRNRGVAYINYTPEEIEEEILAVSALTI